MIVRKGFRVAFILEDGSEVVPRASDAMMHDEDGVDWPYCSVLVGPMRKTNERLDPSIARAGDISFGKGLLIASGVTAIGAAVGGLVGKSASAAWFGAILGSVAGGAYALNATNSNALTRYLGSNYPIHKGEAPVENLPRELSAWTKFPAPVSQIFYERTGYRARDYFEHSFKGPAWLYERGRYLRLQLPKGCVLNERGYVVP